MKKVIVVALVGLSFAGSAFAAEGHTNWQGATDKFTGVITNQAQFDDLIKYADYSTQAKLKAAFKDGKLTAAEIKESGIKDYHFYTGYLSSAKNQTEYDKYLKQMNGGQNMDDKFVSNRDLKAHGSMVMNQVEAGNKLQNTANQAANDKQDARVDKIVSGLQDLGNHILAQTPTLPPVENNNPEPTPGYDDTAIKNQVNTNTGNIANNSNSIQQMGDAFEQRVEKVNDWMTSTDSTLRDHGNALNTLSQEFKAQSNHMAREISRLDGRIDALEEKTDKLKAGVAGAHAVASLTQYTGTGTHHVAVGIGGYEGESALAGGYTYAISANTTIRGTVAYDSQGDFGFGASVGHSW